MKGIKRQMIAINELKRGDIVTYRSGQVNHVNKPYKYETHYNDNFKNKTWSDNMDIIKVQRYVKYLWFYKLETVYERDEKK